MRQMLGAAAGPSGTALSPSLTTSLIPAHRLSLIKEENDHIPEELGESSATDRAGASLWNRDFEGFDQKRGMEYKIG